MVNLKQEGTCKSKTGGAKMTKIFATKALSMVLCFVMLFMGAPVTTWADVVPAITVTKDNAPVPEGDIILNTAGDTLTLTANGFTDGAVSWSLSANAKTWVSLDAAEIPVNGAATATLTLDTLPAFDTTVQVTATGVENESETETVTVSLVKPTDLQLTYSSDDLSLSNGVLSSSPLSSSASVSFGVEHFEVGSWVPVGHEAIFNVSSGLVASVGDVSNTERVINLVGAGTTVATVSCEGKTVAFLLKVNSGINHVSIVTPEGATAQAGGSISLSARAFADADEQNEITDLGDAPFAWSVTEGDSYATVDGSGNVTFNADSEGQTVKVQVASTFDPDKYADVPFTVEAAEPGVAFQPAVIEVTPYTGDGQLGAVAVGDEITYEISYKNYKSEVADVKITSTLDPNVEFVSASDGGAYNNNDSTVTWTLENVSAGTEGTVTLTVKVLEGALASKAGPGQVEASASVGVGAETALETNEVVNLVPEAPTITADQEGAVAVGDEITYTISYKNYMDTVADVKITSRLDSNVEFVGASNAGGYSVGTVTWTLENVAAGAEGTVTLTVKVLEGALVSNGGEGNVSASADVQVGEDAALSADPVENPVEEAAGIISVEDSDGNAVVDGGSFELDSFGNGKLTVTIEPEDAEDATVTVKVNDVVDENVASYENGVITIKGAQADDELTITAVKEGYTFDDFKLTLQLAEAEPAEGIISVEDSAGSGVTNGGSFELDSTGAGTLKVTIEPEDAEDATVTVKVNGAVNADVASYENGAITIKGAADGDTLTITAVKDGYTFDDFTLTLRVPEPIVESVTISSSNTDFPISVGALTLPATFAKEYQLTARAWSEAAGQGTEITGEPFTWSSSDSEQKVIELSVDGKLTVKGPGDATVTATCGDKSATLAVKVERVKAEVKVYKDATMETPVTDLVTFSAGGDKALYVNPVLTGSTDGLAGVSWTVTLGSTPLTVGADGKIDLSTATDEQKLTIKAEHANYNFGEDVVLTIYVEAAAKKDAELQAHLNNTFTAPLLGSVLLDSSGNGALYVRAVDKGTSTAVPGATLSATVTNGSVTIDPVTGAVYITGASDNSVLTISSTTPEGYNTIQPLTITLQRPAAPPVQVYGVNVWRTDDLNMSTVTALTLGVNGSVGLTAEVISNSASDKGVVWSSDKPSVVSVSGTDDAATLTANAVGTATITVTSKDDPSKKHEIEVTVKEAVNLSFTPHAAVYNKDLWVLGLADLARARFARMIGTVPTGTDLTQFTTISIKNSSGEFVVEEEPSTNYLTDIPYYVEDWAASIRGEGLLAVDALPVCFVHSSMSIFELGEYDITLKTLSGQEFTTSINIVDNDFYEDASWTTGSSEGLLIAKMPGMTNDLLVELVSGLKILKDGTHLLKDKGITDILVVDAETGNVYIKKEILDTLEAGTYSIGFTVVGNEELLNFTVVDHRAAWGAPMTRLADRKVQYVDAAGKTSIELTSENLANGILWLLEDSGGTSAWYGIDLSTGAFELDKGSRFYVQWLHKDDAEYDTYYAQLDDEQKSQIENGWIFLIGVEDASGNKVQPESPVKTYVQIGDDWDLDELKAYYIAAGDDQSVDVEDILGFAYPEGEDEFGMMLLSHFSPYLIMDELSDAEKIALGKDNNNKTGDQAVQVAVAGLGSILVLALGIMLRLITRKKKFEE